MADLKIVIGGDARQLQEELKKSQAEISKTAIEANKLDSSLKKTTASAGQSIFNLTEKLRTLQSSVFTEKDRLKIASYNREIKNTEIEIAKLNALGTTSGGAGAFSGIASGAGKAFSAVRQLAYILPGVGIAGIIGFATEPIIKWLTEVKKATGDVKILEDTLAAGAKGSAEEVARLSILKDKIDDLSKPQAERIRLAKIYNETAAEGNKININEIDNLTAINLQIDKQIGLIERQSLAKAAQNEISRFADKQILAEEQLQAALRTTGLTEDQVAKSIDNRIKAQNKLLDNQKKSLDVGGINKIIPIDPKFKESIAQVELVDQKLEGLLLRKRMAAYELNRVIQLLKPSLSDDSFTTKPIKIKPDKIEVVPPEEKDLILIALKNNVYRSVGDPIKIKPVITIEPVIKNTGWMQDIIDKAIADRAQMAAIAKGFNDIIQSTVVDGLSGLGESIGNAIGGGGFENIFKGIFTTLSSGLKELGKYLIKTYGIIAIVQKIKFSNPVLGVAMGVGLVALGALISSQISKTKAFATGVRNFGGGTALVGERGPELVQLPSGSNVVPNGQLNAMSGGGNAYIMETVIRGQDLAVVLKRANQTISRNG